MQTACIQYALRNNTSIWGSSLGPGLLVCYVVLAQDAGSGDERYGLSSHVFRRKSHQKPVVCRAAQPRPSLAGISSALPSYINFSFRSMCWGAAHWTANLCHGKVVCGGDKSLYQRQKLQVNMKQKDILEIKYPGTSVMKKNNRVRFVVE